MADLFLHLFVDTSGVRAKIIEPGTKQILIRDECHVLYSDLSSEEETIDRFASAFNVISEKVTLEGCSSAIIFVLDSFVSFRNIELPFKSVKKINQVIDFELESLLPDNEETYISDFMVTGEVDSASNILTSSIDKSMVDSFFEALAQFNIRPVLITPAGLTASACFSRLQSDPDNLIFIQLFETKATLVLLSEGVPKTVRCFPHRSLSARKLAQSIRQTLTGLDQKTGSLSAGSFYICADDPETDMASIYAAIEEVFNGQIQSEFDNETFDPETLICSISPDRIPKDLFNFCKGEYRNSTFFQTYLTQIATAATLAVVVLILMLVGVSRENAGLERQVKLTDQRAHEIFRLAFPQIKTVRDPYMEMKANVGSAVKNAKSNTGTSGDAVASEIKVVNLLGDISSRVDATLDMEISRFLFSSGRLVLSGSTDNFNNVDKIKSRLEASTYFKKVDISSAASDKRENRVNFKFIIDL